MCVFTMDIEGYQNTFVQIRDRKIAYVGTLISFKIWYNFHYRLFNSQEKNLDISTYFKNITTSIHSELCNSEIILF